MPLKELLSDQFNSFYSNFSAVKSRQTVNSVHRLRVNLKVLKALMLTLDHAEGGNRFEEGNSLFRKVFRSAGPVRETHINRALAREFSGKGGLSDRYIIYLGKLLQGFRVSLAGSLASFKTESARELEKAGVSLSERIDTDQLPEYLNSYIVKQGNRIISKRESDRTDHSIHSIRRILKNIKPVLKLVTDNFPEIKDDVVYDNMVVAEKHIGRWHDLQVFEHSLTTFHDAYSVGNNDLLGEYRGMMRRIRTEKRFLSGAIVRSLEISVKELTGNDFPG